jgi:hypothetical protein
MHMPDVIQSAASLESPTVPFGAGVTVMPLGNGYGSVLAAEPGLELLALDPEQVLIHLAHAGFLLLREFATEPEDMRQFLQVCSRVVSEGGSMENGETPFGPDLVWIMCDGADGEDPPEPLALCDGMRVWEALSEASRKVLTGQQFLHTHVVEERTWKEFVRQHTDPDRSLDEFTLEDLLAQVTRPGETTAELNPDGSVTFRYQVNAAHPTLFGERLAFTNSVLSNEAPRMHFADGSEFSTELREEIERVVGEVKQEVPLRNGDIVLIDNTRVSNGRTGVQTDESGPAGIKDARAYLRQDLHRAVLHRIAGLRPAERAYAALSPLS